MLFKAKNPSYEHLRKKWVAKHKSLQNKLFEKHPQLSRHMLLGGIGSLMLLTTPVSLNLPSPTVLADGEQITKATDKNITLANALKGKVPQDLRSLAPNEEQEIAQILSDNLHMQIVPELEGKRLNRTYGVIGGEQHLYRYPGDNLYRHIDNASEWAMYGSSGIAPGLGAWGYFAPSQVEFTEKDKMREKYYLAVQTFLSPGFAERVKEYRDFYKFRKMVVVNPKTGQTVVAVVGDAGPATWTGKHLGGSPEVMHILGLAGGPRKGPVLYFFVNDPEDQIPLGPIKIQEGES